jgi:hypothetical protein
MSGSESGAPKPGAARSDGALPPADTQARHAGEPPVPPPADTRAHRAGEPPPPALGPGDVRPLEEPVPAGPGAPPLPAAKSGQPEELMPAAAVARLPAPAAPEETAPPAPPPPPAKPKKPGWLAERPEEVAQVPRRQLAWRTRRDFLIFTAGVAAAAAGAWWLLPDRTRARLAPGKAFDALDSLAARAGLTGARRENVLNRALTLDDDVAEALYSKNRSVRTCRDSRQDVARVSRSRTCSRASSTTSRSRGWCASKAGAPSHGGAASASPNSSRRSRPRRSHAGPRCVRR